MIRRVMHSVVNAAFDGIEWAAERAAEVATAVEQRAAADVRRARFVAEGPEQVRRHLERKRGAE